MGASVRLHFSAALPPEKKSIGTDWIKADWASELVWTIGRKENLLLLATQPRFPKSV
jgi:hypothetical protein